MTFKTLLFFERDLALSSLFWCGATDDGGLIIPRGEDLVAFAPVFPRP
jgi:hypothetical protein